MASSTASQSLDLVVRFSTSHPDLVLPLPEPRTTTALSLKQRIRSELPSPASESRLRLIHAGKVLPDQDALSKSLGTQTPPPPAQNAAQRSDKARGKLPARYTVPAARVYIHCSIGDALTATELADEKTRAEEADVALLSDTSTKAATLGNINTTGDLSDGQAASTTPAPRGFDRLLSAGFMPADVATLRTQFLAIQSHTHTPDTMPTGPELLALEERWLDQSSNGAGPSAGMEDAAGEDDLDDILFGTMVGFFWPMGVMCWLMREEGIWSRRRQLLVLVGFFINLIFGLLRLLS